MQILSDAGKIRAQWATLPRLTCPPLRNQKHAERNVQEAGSQIEPMSVCARLKQPVVPVSPAVHDIQRTSVYIVEDEEVMAEQFHLFNRLFR